MRTGRVCVGVVLVLACAGVTVWARSAWAGGAEPLQKLVAYDLFTPSSLRPELWTVSRNGGAATNLDERREIILGRLHLDTRSWSPASLSLNVANPAPIHAIRARVGVTHVVTRRCDSTAPGETVVRASVGGRFFHDAAASKDVGAFADVEYSSAALGERSVRYRVQHCDDDECTAGDTLSSGVMGTIDGVKTMLLSVDWDSAGHRFLFQLETLPLVTAAYERADGTAPSLDRKGLQVSEQVPACPSGEIAVGRVAALFDDVFVNPSGAPLVPESP